jgi:hypothetical protein
MREGLTHPGGPRRPVNVEIIAYAPTVFYHCQHCELTFQQMGLGDRLHRQEAREALPPDLTEQFRDLSDWVANLVHTYGERVSVKVVDAASIEGFWKSLRYRVGTYPTFIVDGRKTRCADLAAATSTIEKEVAAVGQTEEASGRR